MSNEQPSRAAGGLELLRFCPRTVLVLAAAVTLLLFEGIVLLAAVGRAQTADPGPPPSALASRAAPARTTVAAGRRQAVLSPLAAEAAADPGHGPLFTPDLAEVAAPAAPAPVRTPSPAVAVAPPVTPAPPPELPVVAELPPAAAQDEGLDLPGPVTIYLDLLCPGISVGFLDLRLPCRR